MATVPHDLRIALLGPLRVEVGDATVVVPEGHQRRLLAALAVNAGRPVSTDRLVDLLWGPEPPASARNSLQSHLTRLRRHLGGAETIRRVAAGYELAVDADEVDVLRFDRVVDEATRMTDPLERRRLLDGAVAMWRAHEPTGLVAAGLVDEAHRVVRRRIAAHLDRASAAMAAGDLVTSESDARAVLRIDPLDEPAVVVLVRVLAADGRTAEADAAVQKFRDRLGDELGLDPSPRLDAVHTALLRGELLADVARDVGIVDRHDGSSPSVPAARPILPRSSFRGRAASLEELADAVASQRCVTVVGPGGVGKTRLAIELAHRLPRDVVWADLLDTRTRDDVLGRLALAGGCGTPTDLATLSPLAETLEGRRALVVLDNCEQAVAEVAAVVDALLGTTDTTVVATSRTPLAVDGEVVLDLAPLPTSADGEHRSPALTLFADRVGRGLDLDDPVARRGAEEVVAALDGLPLALELGARQARNLGVDALRRRLDHRLHLLGAARASPHPAHSDLRSLVRWSTDQLTAADARVFRWLSVFSGSFTLAQAEDLLGEAGAAVPAPAAGVGRLVEQSLVARRPPDRFRLLETLRACGAEELEDAGEAQDARARHTELVLAAAEAADDRIGTAEEGAGLAAMNAMVADLQVVTDRLVTRRDVEGLCRLAVAVREYAYETQRPELLRASAVAAGLLTDGLGADLPMGLRDGAIVTAAVDATARGDVDLAKRLVAPVVDEGRSSPAAGPAWNILGDTRLWGVETGAADAYSQGARLSEAVGREFAATTGLVGLALAHAYRGNVTVARQVVEELERRADRLGSPLVAAWAAYSRAETEADHDPDAALVAFERAIGTGRVVGGHLVVAAASSGAAAVRARHGDPATVLPHVRDTLRELRGTGNANVQQSVLRNVAVLLARLGSDEAAAVLLGATSSSELYEAERRRIDVATRALAERLGAETVAAARAEGAAMSAGDAVRLALDAVERLVDG